MVVQFHFPGLFKKTSKMIFPIFLSYIFSCNAEFTVVEKRMAEKEGLERPIKYSLKDIPVISYESYGTTKNLSLRSYASRP